MSNIIPNYPGALDSFPTDHTAGDTISSAEENVRDAAIMAMQTEMGLNPSGDYADIATRLETLEFRPIRTVTATTAIVPSDVKGTIVCNPSSGLMFVSLGDDAHLNMNVGATVQIMQIANYTPAVQVVLSSGSVSLSAYTGTQLGGWGAVAILQKIGANTWNLSGNVVSGGTTPPPPTGPFNQLPLLLGMNN